eukprot:scaffold7580_cov325-Pinguiococcus_pyrenoidosus.AAC.4
MQVHALVFGDLHLEDIRAWRFERMVFEAPLDSLEMLFPVWHADYDVLLEELESAPGEAFICAVGDNCPEEAHDFIHIGAPYKTVASVIKKSGFDIDLFGERGEFHSVVVFEGMDAEDVLARIRRIRLGAEEDGTAVA